MNKSKVLCGLCNRVLFNPTGRQPTRGERAQLEALPPSLEPRTGGLLRRALAGTAQPAEAEDA